MTIAPGQTLSHYRLIQKIGKGGMGVVWKAEDKILGRTVAIKVLPADAAWDEKRRKMFFDEARLASSLSEAHIVQVHEFGREDDLDFIVMEYIEGKPLSQMIHQRPMPPRKVADIGLQVASALSKAHHKQLLHRDLKPSNILVTPDGEAKVVDFGLATLLNPPERKSGPDSTTHTMTDSQIERHGTYEKQAIAGTLGYMSPEQLRGERLDSRSDIFSFGVVLYEMTTGRRPFRGATPWEVAEDIQKGQLDLARERVPNAPADLGWIIQKSLAARPGDRYQTTDDLAVDLRHLCRDLETGLSSSHDSHGEKTGKRPRRGIQVAALVFVLLVTLGVLSWQRDWWPWSGAATPQKVLILPFEVRGQPQGPDYIGRAFAETLAVNLSQAKELSVLPLANGTDVKEFGSIEHPKVAAALGAKWLLAGAITQDTRSVRVILNLVDVPQNRIFWGTQQEDLLGDGVLSALATSLSADVVKQLGISPSTLFEYPPNMVGSPSMRASPLMTQAIGALRRHDLNPALEATEGLIKAFPHQADAHVLRIFALLRLLDEDPSQRRLVEDALAALQRLDPRHPFAEITSCGLAIRERKWLEGIRCSTETLRRVDLSPSGRASVYRMRAEAENDSNRFEQALADIMRACRLDPMNFVNFHMRGDVQMNLADLDGAAASFQQSMALAPNWDRNYWHLSMIFEQRSQWEEAVRMAAKTCELGDSQHLCARYATVLLKAGRKEEGFAEAAKAATMAGSGPGPYHLAGFYALAGETDKAIRYLRQWLNAGAWTDDWIPDDPDFTALHGNREFESIFAEVRRRIESRAVRPAE